jgi:hypothetical protein
MIDDTMILPPRIVRRQALATACFITNSHGYATDHVVLTCDRGPGGADPAIFEGCSPAEQEAQDAGGTSITAHSRVQSA